MSPFLLALSSFHILGCECNDLGPAAILCLDNWIDTLRMVEEEDRKSLRPSNPLDLSAVWLHLGKRINILIPSTYCSKVFLTSSWKVIPGGFKEIYTIFKLSENWATLITCKSYYLCPFDFPSHVKVCDWKPAQFQYLHAPNLISPVQTPHFSLHYLLKTPINHVI